MGSRKLPSSFLLVAPWCSRIRITWKTSFQVVLTLLVPRPRVEKLLPQDMSFANRPELTRPHVGPERRAGAANLLLNRWGKKKWLLQALGKDLVPGSHLAAREAGQGHLQPGGCVPWKGKGMFVGDTAGPLSGKMWRREDRGQHSVWGTDGERLLWCPEI